MTDAPARRARLSKGRVRAVAWVAGGATFLTGIGILGVAPKPASSSAPARESRSRRPVVVHRVLRRVIVTEPAASAPVRVIPGSATSGGSTGGASSGAPAPAPAPQTTTGGS